MAEFSFYGNPIMSDELFAQLLNDDKGLREAVRNVTTYCDKFGNRIGEYVNYPSWKDVHDITEEQQKIAKEKFEKRRTEQIAHVSQPGTLCLVTTGCDFTPACDGGLGNFRIRGRFFAKEIRWMIELHARVKEENGKWIGPDETLGFFGELIPESVNDSDMKGFNEKLDSLNEEYKGKIPLEVRQTIKWPVYRYERIESRLPLTADGVLEFVNRKFGTKFTSLYLDRYLLGTDDVISHD